MVGAPVANTRRDGPRRSARDDPPAVDSYEPRGLHLQHDAYLGIANTVRAAVALGQPVVERAGRVVHDRLNFAADLQEAVRVLRIDDGDRDSRLVGDVTELLALLRVREREVLAIPPDELVSLTRATRHHRYPCISHALRRAGEIPVD